ncbi:glycosyl hydrolase family 28-related protein [Bacillus velezensis]|nr:glycosyl hydrolase family 28-related protein [Bacillus velezensis]
MRNYIDGLYNRIKNLILNADGTNVKEVVDARVDADGNIAPLLKERLDKEYNKSLRKIVRNVNVDDYGADPTGETDSSEAFKRAIGNGKVRLIYRPASTLSRASSFRHGLTLSGKERITILQLHEDTPASEWVVTNADHVKGNRNIVVEGVSRLESGPSRWRRSNRGLSSSCLLFAQVKFGIVRDVEAIRPGRIVLTSLHQHITSRMKIIRKKGAVIYGLIIAMGTVTETMESRHIIVSTSL